MYSREARPEEGAAVSRRALAAASSRAPPAEGQALARADSRLYCTHRQQEPFASAAAASRIRLRWPRLIATGHSLSAIVAIESTLLNPSSRSCLT